MSTDKYKYGTEIIVSTEGNSPYRICLRDSFAALSDNLRELGCTGHRICIVTDSNVAPLFLEEVSRIAKECCSLLEIYKFPAGEQQKTLDTVRALYELLIQVGFDRHDYLLALGGGVVGDLTGFAAATYLRGIRFIQVPTTLLAQIDSSIGGKTGVDFDCYKNMVGAFHQPALVYINTRVLQTLPENQFASGMGELLKYGLILDADFYQWTADHIVRIKEREPSVMLSMVARSCELKKYIVEKDPKETKGDRALLNFGHTIGHAIEKLKDFQLLHGECVALGSLAAADISRRRGWLSEKEFSEIHRINTAFDLPVSFEGPSAADIVAATKKDKKMDAGKIRFVLLKEIGHAVLTFDVTEEEMTEAVSCIKKEQ